MIVEGYASAYRRLEEGDKCDLCIICRFRWNCRKSKGSFICHKWIIDEVGNLLCEYLGNSDEFAKNWLIEYVNRISQRLIGFGIAEITLKCLWK